MGTMYLGSWVHAILSPSMVIPEPRSFLGCYFNRLTILGKANYMEIFMFASWNIWKERNNLIFNGIDPELNS
jgi:hypothetical protein